VLVAVMVVVVNVIVVVFVWSHGKHAGTAGISKWTIEFGT
jgi:hypothetical protein